MTNAARYHEVDLLRLVMSVQMIQGHAIASLLSEEARNGPVFSAWTFARGLTAVGFLIAAGASYFVVMGKEADAAAAAKGRARRVRRALLLIAVGFALRPPVGLFSGDSEVALSALDHFFTVDVLQCIGVTLLSLEGLRRVLPARVFVPACVGLGLAVIATSPWMATLDADRPLSFLVAWLSRRTGSVFPLFPWSGFVFLGVGVGALVVRARGWELAVVGGLSLLVGWGLMGALPSVAPDDYYAWPPFSLVRAGLVLLLLSGFSVVARGIQVLPRILTTLTGETLVLYVVHLVILHAGGIGLIALLGTDLSPAAAISVAVLLIVVSAGLALGWARLRAARRER